MFGKNKSNKFNIGKIHRKITILNIFKMLKITDYYKNNALLFLKNTRFTVN